MLTVEIEAHHDFGTPRFVRKRITFNGKRAFQRAMKTLNSYDVIYMAIVYYLPDEKLCLKNRYVEPKIATHILKKYGKFLESEEDCEEWFYEIRLAYEKLCEHEMRLPNYAKP